MSRDPNRLDPPTVPRPAVDAGRATRVTPRRPQAPSGDRAFPRERQRAAQSGDTPRGVRPRPRADGPRADHQPRRAPRPVPVLLVLLLAAAGAGALGYMGHVTGGHAFRGSWEFSRLGGPWLLAGFVGGAIGGWRRGLSGLVLGAFVGAVIVGAGSVAYYGLSYWAGGNGARRAAKLGIGWGTAGVGVGSILGLLGAAYSTALGRHRPRDGGRPEGSWLHGAAFGTLGGLLMGEAIALLWVWNGVGLRAMASLEGVGAVLLVLFGSVIRSWRFFVAALIFAAISASVAPVATTMLRESLRTIGWAGA